jgi:hypothetical protein
MQIGAEQRFPRWWQALLIIGGCIVLGISSCAGFLNGVGLRAGGNGALAYVFAIIFLACVAGTIAGIVLLLIAIARAIVNALAPPAVSPEAMGAIPAAAGGEP